MQQTSEQLACVAAARVPRGDLLISALAGTGKTFTLMRMLEVLPQLSVLVCAFNKRIAEEFKQKMPPPRRGTAVHVQTFHSIGFGILRQNYPGISLDNDATEELILEAETRRGRKQAPKIRGAAVRLLRQYKEVDGFGNRAREPEEFVELGHAFGLLNKLDEAEAVRTAELAVAGYNASFDIVRRGKIDFCDMVWAPIALNLPSRSRYQAVIVDEWQDLSRPQFELVQRMIAPGGRLIMAGDIHQAIYGWRGAVGTDVEHVMMTGRQAKRFPLTTTFRCARAVTREAQALVPTLQHTADAEEGSVRTIGIADLPRLLAQAPVEPGAHHTFVLSRTNAELLDIALKLWQQRIRFQLNAGRDMLDPLFNLLDNNQLTLGSPAAFRASVKEWRERQHAKAAKVGTPAAAHLVRVDEQASMLLLAAQYAQPFKIKELLTSILAENTSGVLLSSVHKVKGLEAERVFLLKQTFARWEPTGLIFADDDDIDGEYRAIVPGGNVASVTTEELNIEYVAITRARTHLIWVDLARKNKHSFVVPGHNLGGTLPRQLTREQIEGLQAEYEDEAVRLAGAGKLKESDAMAKIAVELRNRLGAP